MLAVIAAPNPKPKIEPVQDILLLDESVSDIVADESSEPESFVEPEEVRRTPRPIVAPSPPREKTPPEPVPAPEPVIEPVPAPVESPEIDPNQSPSPRSKKMAKI